MRLLSQLTVGEKKKRGAEQLNTPHKIIRVEIGRLIGKIHAGHGVEIVDALKIPQRQGTGQIGHGHGIEPLHGEGEILD